jgi:fatty acid desaturase
MTVTYELMTVTMAPVPQLLAEPRAEARVAANGKPLPSFRDELRTIPWFRNALSVASAWAQTIGVLALAVWLHHPAMWIAAFFLMGRANAQLASLMHEAAHRMLFANRKVNDFVGRWIVGYPVFVPIDVYRRGHMGHHREEFGPNEPDIALYRAYPIPRDSMRRKLTRDLLGITGVKLMRGLFSGLRAEKGEYRREARSILAVQVVIATGFTIAGYWYLYPLLWLLPHLTVWRAISRFRGIAEHGGMVRSGDRRETTHTVLQHPIARFWMVPFNIGWHLAHHVDSGIPWRNLPKLHDELCRAGYVQPELEYPSYRAIWRKLGSG